MTQTEAVDDGYDEDYAETDAAGPLDPWADDPQFDSDFYEDN
jgi:hypothetical protein